MLVGSLALRRATTGLRVGVGSWFRREVYGKTTEKFALST